MTRRKGLHPATKHKYVPAPKRRARLKSGEGRKEHINIRIRESDRVILNAMCDHYGWSQSALITTLIVDRYRALIVEDESFAKSVESRARK